MLFSTYQGNYIYTITIRDHIFNLTKEEIDLIRDYDFDKNEPELHSSEELKEQIEDLKWECQNLLNTIPELETLTKEFKDILKRILE
jgi:hypothetical protein